MEETRDDTETAQRKEAAGMVWHSSPDNRRDWMASTEHLCHVIVVMEDNTAVLRSMHAEPWPDSYPVEHFTTFTQAARCAADRTAGRAETAMRFPARLAPARYLASCSTTPKGEHWYLSTSCLHGEDKDGNDLHQHCQGGTNHAGGAKVPGGCKFCDAQCVCECHQRTEQEAQQ